MEELLDRLDAEPATAVGASRRATERYAYRGRTLQVEFLDSPVKTVYSVPARNLSRTGAAFLMGRFIYPGAVVSVRLVSEYQHEQVVRATVVRCQYLRGSGSVYDVGLRFEKPIDMALFHRAATRVRVLLVDDDELQNRIACHFLKKRNADVVPAFDVAQALELAGATPFDLILIDMDVAGADGLAMVRELRSRGYSRPIVATPSIDSPEVRQHCLEAGCTDVALKPLEPATVDQLVAAIKTEPVVSRLANDPEMAPMIDEFVNDVTNAVAELESAIAGADLAQLEARTRVLRERAGCCGFESIADTTRELETALKQGLEVGELRRRLHAVTRLAYAARPAS